MELRNLGSTLGTKYLASFRFWFTDNYAMLQRIISDRSFRFFHRRELFIAASRINYLFCAKNFKQNERRKEFPRASLAIPTIYFDFHGTKNKFTSWNSRDNPWKMQLSYKLHETLREIYTQYSGGIFKNFQKHLIVMLNVINREGKFYVFNYSYSIKLN